VVSYSVKIGFAVPQGAGLRAGMSATADIILSDRSDALLLPDRAIKYDSQGGAVVYVVVSQEPEGDMEIEERTVVIGISDGFQTEIISGLQEGETVFIEAPAGAGESSEPAFHFMGG
jgi:multidrug efflux pump subunit AcrA (membrane-fusion protein)